MRKTLGFLLFCTSTVFAQSPAPVASANNSQLNLQFLADVLRSAAASRSAIQGMNLDKTFSDGGATSAGRTAAVMGAGAGVGAAIGEMSHSQKGLLIGAIAGGAGALIIDQILQHNAAKVPQAPEFRQ
jgi:hypothetical protein